MDTICVWCKLCNDVQDTLEFGHVFKIGYVSFPLKCIGR